MSRYKTDFPIFDKQPDLIYLDSGATSQKPRSVIEAISNQLAYENGSPHRGAHQSSVKATALYLEAKKSVGAFIGGAKSEEIIFTKNATEALNLLAYGYGLSHVTKEQNIVVAITSHHSNLLPWQMVAQKTGAELRYLYLDEKGEFTSKSLLGIDPQTAIVAFPMISNAYGMVHPVKDLIERAKKVGAVTVVDGAQAVGHMLISVKELDCDFFVFSGHKIFAPQGIGVLYGKSDQLEKIEPFLRGGDMIEYVSEQTTSFAKLPERLEAGTQNVTGAVGLRAAIDYIESIGVLEIHRIEEALVRYALNAFGKLPFIKIVGPNSAESRGSLITFTVEGVHPHDVASLLDHKGIAIRAGHHCCQPLMAYLEVPSSCRISFSVYNTAEDVDALIEGLFYVREVFGYER